MTDKEKQEREERRKELLKAKQIRIVNRTIEAAKRIQYIYTKSKYIR